MKPLHAHLPRVKPPTLKIRPKLPILALDRILPNTRQRKKRQKRTEDAKTATHKERILPTPRARLAARRIPLDDREHVGPDKGADFATRGRDGVVLPPDGSGRGLGRDEADVVPRPGLAEGEEDAVDDDEASDVGGLVEFAVRGRHDEAHYPLREDADAETEARADDIRQEGAGDGAGEVEDVDERVPGEGLPERGRGAEDEG